MVRAVALPTATTSLSIFLSLASGLKALPFSMQMVASMPRISALEASFGWAWTISSMSVKKL